MKGLFAGILLAGLAATTGCGKDGKPGGPGATEPSAKSPTFGQADDTFNLTAPSVSIKAGETYQGAVAIKRGTNFAQDVTLGFADLPKGVAVSPAAPVLLSKETEAKFTLTAGDDAAPGEYMVKLTGHPAKGGDATNMFKLTVGKRDTFTLSMPFWTTGLKQGESKTVAIAISRDKTFDQDVALKFDGLPKGVTVEPASPVIRNGEAEAKVVLTAADDVAVGNATVMVTGHPGKGADASHELKFTVARKDTFTLGVPFWTTGLKQGESRAVTISISREKTFDQDVTVKFDGLPKGVTVEPADGVIKNGDPDAKFTIKAADDAPLGDFSAKVMGHPAKGADASHDFKFTVGKK